jgi:hypothetical protein
MFIDKKINRSPNLKNTLSYLFSLMLLTLMACGGGSDGEDADTVAPVISIVGDNPATVFQGSTYTDAGATATDNVDGSVSVTTSGSVDTSTVGEYTLTYTASDSAGNESSATRTVNVVADTTAPVITINGDNPASVEQNNEYVDAGATAEDDADGTVDVATSGSVDTTTVGEYTITYTAVDSAGNQSTSTRTVNVTMGRVKGVAAAGAAIVGTVTVKGSLGMTTSSLIEADGSYDIDVTGLTAPFRLRAQGTVGGKNYVLYSYAETTDLGNTINITPFTDLIIANVAQQIAQNFFDSEVMTSLSSDEVMAQEAALQAKLQQVFDALGLEAAIDLLRSSFAADHSGLDAALDIVQIESTGDNIVTITNILDGSSIEDDISDQEDNDATLPADAEDVQEAVTETQAIANLFINFAAEFAEELPSTDALEDYFSEDFLLDDNTRGEFITDISTDPSIIGLGFSSVSISNLDSTAGTATVDFHVFFNGEVDSENETWLVARHETLGWQLRGNQRIVDLNSLSFHCNDNDGSDGEPGGCGINVMIRDENFTNNGTNGAPIASASVSIIDGTDGTTVKGIVYLGTSQDTAPGDIQVYNEAGGHFQGDWRGFGTAQGEIDPSIFIAGDMIEYKIFTQDLDLSTPTQPSVATGTEIATYVETLSHAPSLTPLYPTVSSETLAALESFTIGDSLTVSWTLAEGTVSEEVLFMLSDQMGNRVEIWDESFGPDATTTSFSSASITAALSDNEDFNPAESYEISIRVYAEDAITRQAHSVDYRVEKMGDPNALVCGYESGWDDTADEGLGAPINPNSFADFETVITACGGAMSIQVSDVAGKSFSDFEETTSFFDTGSGTEADPGTGEFNEGTGEAAIPFEWYVETVNGNDYLVLYTDSTIAQDLPTGHSVRETTALISLEGEAGVSGTQYSFVKYSEGSNYGDMVRATGDDGEIWNSTDTLQ